MTDRFLSLVFLVATLTSVAAQQPPVAKPDAAPVQPAVIATPAPPLPAGGVPDMEPARPILVTKREMTARLQIFLDQKMFSPGMIDGVSGRFLSEALKRWQRANGLEETGVLDEKVPLDSIHPLYIFHKMAKEELKWIGDSPGKPSEQAKKKYLPYSNYTEYLAERYHCSVDFLKGLNPTLKFGALSPGDEIRVPNVEPFKIEEMPPMGNFPDVPEFASRHIVIHRKATILELYEGEKLLATVPIAPGSPTHPTPPGKWRILGVSAMPNFRWDKGVLNHGVRTDEFYMLPSGPNNPVGVGWLGLNKPGIGIHGTNNPYSIGTWASHGCMRTANWDIARLSKMVTKGMSVEIK